MTPEKWLLLGLLAIVPALILSMLSTSEVVEYPLFSRAERAVWFLVLWLLPYAGVLLVHRKLGLGWGSGADRGGGDTINVADPGHGGGGGGDHGGT